MVTKIKSKAKKAFVEGRNIPQYPEETMQLPGINENDSIEEMFKNEMNGLKTDVNELFHEDKVKTRTDISARQVKLITKAFYLSKIVGMPEINELLLEFMKLRISDSRKSRAEFVEGLKAKIDNAVQMGQMGLRGQFGK